MTFTAPKFPYDAVIIQRKSEEYWRWEPWHYTPELDMNGKPTLHYGDLIRIRLSGCTNDCPGPHELLFTCHNKKELISPFEGQDKGYLDVASSMFKVSREAQDTSWSITIHCRETGVKIDPEMHVGTGPARPESE